MKLCGVVIHVHHTHEYIRRLCREYRVEDDAVSDVSVSADREAVEAEKRLCGKPYPDGVYEATCIHREIVRALVPYGVILMHGAVVAVDGRAYVFMAKSGVGKSTHVQLWRDVFGERAVVVNGDKPFFSFAGETLMAHGSPWKGKEGLGAPMSVPVLGICFLERGDENVIRPAAESEVVERLFHQVLLPGDRDALAMFMSMINRILQTVPFYVLQCNMEKEAALVAYEGMRKDTTP